jgi:hypothetical protein
VSLNVRSSRAGDWLWACALCELGLAPRTLGVCVYWLSPNDLGVPEADLAPRWLVAGNCHPVILGVRRLTRVFCDATPEQLGVLAVMRIWGLNSLGSDTAEIFLSCFGHFPADEIFGPPCVFRSTGDDSEVLRLARGFGPYF